MLYLGYWLFSVSLGVDLGSSIPCCVRDRPQAAATTDSSTSLANCVVSRWDFLPSECSQLSRQQWNSLQTPTVHPSQGVVSMVQTSGFSADLLSTHLSQCMSPLTQSLGLVIVIAVTLVSTFSNDLRLCPL